MTEETQTQAPTFEPIQLDEAARRVVFALGQEFGPISQSGLVMKAVEGYAKQKEQIAKLEAQVVKAEQREGSALDHVAKLTKQILAMKEKAKAPVKRGPGRPRKDASGQGNEEPTQL